MKKKQWEPEVVSGYGSEDHGALQALFDHGEELPTMNPIAVVLMRASDHRKLLRGDPKCICRGNWRAIVKETEHLIGERFRNRDKEYTFFGVVHGGDDYYYGMWRDGELRLLSCVGSLETAGFELVPKLARKALTPKRTP